MKTQFVKTRTGKQALKKCPWAFCVVKVVGGYLAFDTQDTYRTWLNQQ